MRLLVFFSLVALLCARPLEWSTDETYEMPVEKHLRNDLSSAIEKVKISCIDKSFVGFCVA
jgi:hypothetical protein